MAGKNKRGLNEIRKLEAWEKFVGGSSSSFEDVFKSYFKSLLGYGVKLCSQPELVKDCIQELFRNLWERRDDLTHIDSPNVYLVVSLRRKILQKLKTQRKENGDLNEAGEAFAKFNKEEIIINKEMTLQQKKKLKQALNQLPNRQKEVIYLHFYNGMSYGEIERILSINRQSVRNHVYRAMERLRSILNNKLRVVNFK